MLTKPFKPLALAFLVNLIISVEDKIKYKNIQLLVTTTEKFCSERYFAICLYFSKETPHSVLKYKDKPIYRFFLVL